MSEPGDSSDGNRCGSVPPMPTDASWPPCAPYRYITVRDGKIGQAQRELTFIPSANAKGWGSAAARESLFVLATDVEQNVIYVGEGDDHPGLYHCRALRIAPGELHLDPPGSGN